jgi:hypothetical protein
MAVAAASGVAVPQMAAAATSGAAARAAAATGLAFDWVDWHLSMTRIFQAMTLGHHAKLLPLAAICLYYEG